MNFTNYCIVMLGDVAGGKDEIKKIAEQVNHLENTGVIISTFCSAMSTGELKTYFTDNKRNFVLFEMNKDCYGANLNDAGIYQKIFGDVEDNDIRAMKDKFVKEMVSRKLNEINVPFEDAKIITDDIDFDNLSSKDREKMINNIFDKGLDNITDKDKKILEKLTK